MTASGYGSPQALRRAVTDRLRALGSGRPGSRLADLHRQFAYDRLLCRVFTSPEADRWVLKGATALLARLAGNSRHTLDVDLYDGRGSDLREAEQSLRAAAAIDLGDHFRFTLKPGRRVAQDGVALRVPVDVLLGVTVFASFHVDLVTGLAMTGTPEEVEPLVPMQLAGVQRSKYRVYPLADHISDKVFGLIEQHMRADGPAVGSTRYRDLADLVVIAHRMSVDAGALATALRSQAVHRGIELPDRLRSPAGSDWRPGYARVVRDVPDLEERDLASAVETAARFLTPVLSGTSKGTWEPALMAWE